MYYVAAAADDWYNKNTTGDVTGTSLLFAGVVNSMFPPFTYSALAEIDTSGIGTDVISAATFYLDSGAYTASRRVTKTYKIQIYDGVSAYVTIKSGTWSAAGTISEVLTGGELAYINKTGKTKFRVITDDPGAGKDRSMSINAYETSQATAMRMDVTHAPATAAYTHVMVLTS